MDPLTALGLASNIIQFVDFTSKFFSSIRELYLSSSGAKGENLELESIVRDIQEHAERVRPSDSEQRGTIVFQDNLLLDLSDQCIAISNELLSILESLKVNSPNKSWESFYQALKSQWKKKEIDGLQRRLDRIGNQMNARALLKQQATVISKLERLVTENRRLEVNRTQEILGLQENITLIFKQIQEESKKDITSAKLRQLTLATERGLEYSEEQSFLNFIRFDAIEDRQIAVHAAHHKTFSWIFRSSDLRDQYHNSANFADWLVSDHTLFWVSGKPGSGKSTLMKYMSEQNTTKEMLKTWANGQRLVVANFFFWNAGRQILQKSQDGLLRSILYQILCQCPDLIPEVKKLLEGLTTPKLLSVFEKIAARLVTSKVKFCFLIDGLDEYEGKPDAIIQLVGFLKSTLQVKICVSSRPWNEFEKAFGQDKSKKLYMQELTRGDIELYVRDTLENDPAFKELKQRDHSCPDLVEDVIDAAEGVFLWVVLVVRSLLEGLTNADRIVDLQRRLKDMPTDLNDYFERILFTVDNFYRRETAQMFQVTLVAQDILPLMAYWFMDQNDPTLLENIVVAPLSFEAINRRLSQMQKRLNACCKGLLEAQLNTSAVSIPSRPTPEERFFHLRVDFLHRTVRDFLRIPEMVNMVNQWVGSNFEENIVICEALVCQLKTTPSHGTDFRPDGQASKLLEIFFHHIKILDDGQCPVAREVQILNEFERALKTHQDNLPRADSILQSSNQKWRDNILSPVSVLEKAIQIGLTRYVSLRLDQSLISLTTQSLLLLTALLPPVRQTNPDPRLKMVSLLLGRGFDPNGYFGTDHIGNRRTVWLSYLIYEYETLKENGQMSLRDNDFLIKELLKHGADADAGWTMITDGDCTKRERKKAVNVVKFLVTGVEPTEQELGLQASKPKWLVKAMFWKKNGKSRGSPEIETWASNF